VTGHGGAVRSVVIFLRTPIKKHCALPVLLEQLQSTTIESIRGSGQRVRKLIAFDDDTFDKLKQLGRDRMATLQELADEAFADLLRKHGVPIDLKDALRKSAQNAKSASSSKTAVKSSQSRKTRS
jgi:non-homologous end joining protein Ku